MDIVQKQIFMKILKNSKILLALMAVGVFSLALTGCDDKCDGELVYKANVPVYLSYSDLRKPIKADTPKALHKPAKIWIKNNTLFVVDLNTGFHVIDISNLNSPSAISFVQVPGIADIAVKGDNLYADSFIDLLVFDISNPSAPNLIKRVENTFPYDPLRVEPNEGYPVIAAEESKGVVIAWKTEEVRDKSSCTGSGYFYYGFEGGMLTSSTTNVAQNYYSQGGSLARFTLVGDYFYSVDHRNLLTFDVTNPLNPTRISSKNVGWNIETLIAANNYLFIGSRTAMIIYGLSNPADPTLVANFPHGNACDPVVVQGNTAFVTLRSGTFCQNSQNELQVIDITNITNPSLIKTYPMTNPWGLGIDGKILAVCESNFGVTVFNAQNTSNLTTIGKLSTKAKDVIMYQGRAIFMGDGGIQLMSYDDSGNFTPGGIIPIVLE
jgi:hypothetical protein